jgi:hypothetical protein
MIRSQRESYPRIVVKASWDVGEPFLHRHDNYTTSSPALCRCSRLESTPPHMIEMAGTRPAMTQARMTWYPSRPIGAGDDCGISRTSADIG